MKKYDLVFLEGYSPPLDIQIANDRNINGNQKSIRFRDNAYEASKVGELYFSGPNKLVLPDIRGVDYIGSLPSQYDIGLQIGSTERSFLNKGADLVNDALDGMNTFFRKF